MTSEDMAITIGELCVELAKAEAQLQHDCNICPLQNEPACDEICANKSTLIARIAKDRAELEECHSFIKGVCDAAEEAYWGVQDNQEYNPEQRGRDMVEIPLNHAIDTIIARAEKAEAEAKAAYDAAKVAIARTEKAENALFMEQEILSGELGELKERTEKAEAERDVLASRIADELPQRFWGDGNECDSAYYLRWAAKVVASRMEKG